uniref:Holin n=1 Tax=Pseudomonas phage HRDY3 TaxID=3236930 RepID=A0AB39CEN9_9VIRU
MHDRSVNGLLFLCVLVVVFSNLVAYQIVNGELSLHWLWAVVFMILQMGFAIISHSLDRPVLENTFGRLYVRFKMSHDWIYITDPKGNRNNVIFSFGFIEKDGIDARCWNLVCLAFAFSIGVLPKRNKRK